MNYIGIIIEESLQNKEILKNLQILRKRKEKVTSRHKTPWLTVWTLDTIIIPEKDIKEVGKSLSESFDTTHKNSWYIDFKNNKFHYIIFPHKIFKVNLENPNLYEEAEKYGESLGIPSYQMQFSTLRRKLEE